MDKVPQTGMPVMMIVLSSTLAISVLGMAVYFLFNKKYI